MTAPYGRPDKGGKTKQRGEERRRYYVKWKYGVEWEDYQALVKGGCRICGTKEAPVWHVDHDTNCCKTAKNSRYCGQCTRGVLCPLCNQMLGHARHDVEILRSAIKYMEEWNARTRDDRLPGVVQDAHWNPAQHLRQRRRRV